MTTKQRYDHYYSIEGDGEFEEGHIFCTIAEGERLQNLISAEMPDYVTVTIEPGGEYDYTTEDGTSAEDVADDIVRSSGFVEESES
jgi:hypothetical protein